MMFSHSKQSFSDCIDSLSARTMNGERLSRSEILMLLEVDPNSKESEIMHKKGREMATLLCGNKGKVWSAIGIENKSCAMNCEFCSFGKKWGLVKKEFEWSEEDILDTVKMVADCSVTWITLRTTEYYSVEKLCALSEKIHRKIKGTFSLVINSGELSVDDAKLLKKSGIIGAYHTLRLGEGKNTHISPAVRLNTMKAIHESGLKLYHLIEPLGIEHSNDEIADRLIASQDCGAVLGGVMARINVKGTPFEGEKIVDEERISHLVAVSRICGGNSTPDVCVVPPTLRSLQAGANVVTTEIGSVPRSEQTEHQTVWNNFGIREAYSLLQKAGYVVPRIIR